jgi:hypothetical protein
MAEPASAVICSPPASTTDGGDGFDTVSYEDYTEGVAIYGEPWPGDASINILDTFVNVEKIVVAI